jgi:hypothetical protein
MGTQRASNATRAGVAARCAAPAGPQSRAGARALLPDAAAWRRALARPIVHTATHPAAHPRSLRPTVPGIGQLRRRGLLYEMPALQRFPRVQAWAAAGRLVPWASAAAGPRSGPSGRTIGQAQRQGAWSAAAGLCLREQPAAPPWRARVEQTHGQGTALPILAQPVARALASMVQRQPAFALDPFRHGAGRGAGAPQASLDSHGLPRSHHARSGGNPCGAERPGASRA